MNEGIADRNSPDSEPNQVQFATRRFCSILEGTANIASLQALKALPAHGVDYTASGGGND
jgi:hypothetical protein